MLIKSNTQHPGTVVIGSMMLAGVSAANDTAIFSAAPTQSGSVFFDIERLPDVTNADALFARAGLTITGSHNSRNWNPVVIAGGHNATSDAGMLGVSASPSTLSLNFSSAISFAEFFFSDTETFAGTTYSITAFDAGAVLLESLSVTAANLGTRDYVGVVRGAEDVSRIDITPSNNDQNCSIDDLCFGASAVKPEPGVLALLNLGLVGLGFARRKRAA